MDEKDDSDGNENGIGGLGITGGFVEGPEEDDATGIGGGIEELGTLKAFGGASEQCAAEEY